MCTNGRSDGIRCGYRIAFLQPGEVLQYPFLQASFASWGESLHRGETRSLIGSNKLRNITANREQGINLTVLIQ